MLDVKDVLPSTSSLLTGKCVEKSKHAFSLLAALKKAMAKKGLDGEPFLSTVPPLLTSQLGEIDIHAAFFPTKSLFRLWDMMRKPFFPFL